MSLDAAAVTSTIARLNASSFALDGLLKPLSLRTNCSAEARISVSVAGGSKLNRVLMLRHMSLLRYRRNPLGYFVHRVEWRGRETRIKCRAHDRRHAFQKHLAARSFRRVPAA